MYADVYDSIVVESLLFIAHWDGWKNPGRLRQLVAASSLHNHNRTFVMSSEYRLPT